MKKYFKLLILILLGSLCLGSAFSTNLNENIYSYHTFDNTLSDSIGGNSFINYGADYRSGGFINGAYNFNGDYMKKSGDIDGARTINMWIYITSSNQGFIYYSGNSDGNDELSLLWRGSSDSNMQIRAKDLEGNFHYISTPQNSISQNSWNMITGIFDGNQVSIYINSVQKGSFSMSGIIDYNSYNYIGKRDYSNSPTYFTGYIDEFSQWNKALNSTEITDLYNKQRSGKQYPFEIPKAPTINSNISSYYNTNNISIHLNSTTNTNMSYFLDNNSITNICNNCNSTTLNLNSLLEGTHSILFESTDSNGQINSTYNFTIDTIKPQINIFNSSEINSYLINWTQHFNYSDTNLDSCHVTVENATQNCSTYNFIKNGNQTIDIFVNDSAGNSINKSYIQLVNPYQYFRFYDNARALNIENYSFGNYNSSGQYVIIPLNDLGLGDHFLEFSKFGYSQDNFSFNFNTTSKINQTFNGTAVTLTIKVYDENSPSTQLKYNLSMNNVSNYTQYLNQLNFQKYYNETLTGNLTLTTENTGFSLRKVFTQLNPYSTVSHKIYLLANSKSTHVIFRVLNLGKNQAIKDVVFTFKKEISGTPTFLGQAKTDSQGYTYFNMDVGSDYIITISKDGYVSQVINSIPGKTDYTILMKEKGSTSSFLFDKFSYIINPLTTPDSIPFNVSTEVFDEANLISSMKFTVTGNNTYKTQTLTTANGGTIQFQILNSSSQYVLNLTVNREGKEYNFIKKINYYKPVTSNATVQKVANELQGGTNSEDRVFMIIILYIIAIVLGSLFSSTIGAVFGLLPITIFAFVGWITPGIAALMFVFTILGVLYFEK